jgi:hypothetical protein
MKVNQSLIVRKNCLPRMIGALPSLGISTTTRSISIAGKYWAYSWMDQVRRAAKFAIQSKESTRRI